MNTTNESTELNLPGLPTRVTRVTISRLKSTAQFEHRKIEMAIDIGPEDIASRVIPLAIDAADIVLEDPPYFDMDEAEANQILAANDRAEEVPEFTLDRAREVKEAMDTWRERRRLAIEKLDGMALPTPE